MGQYTNLYTFLINHVNLKYIFGDRIIEDIESGYIKVNDQKPKDINMTLKFHDLVTVNDVKYEITQAHVM